MPVHNTHRVYTPVELDAHVRSLADAFNVVVKVDHKLRPDDAGAGEVVNLRTGQVTGIGILIAPVSDESTYAVTLHELGHCCSPLGMLKAERERARSRGRNLRLLLDEEHAAWEWAMHYALTWTPLMEYVHQYAITTYTAHVNRILYRRVK